MGGRVEKLIKITGTPPPCLHTVLTDNEDAIDKHLFSPLANLARGKDGDDVTTVALTVHLRCHRKDTRMCASCMKQLAAPNAPK